MQAAKIGCTNAGLFSNFRGTVSTFLQCEKSGLTPYVEWRGTPYFDGNVGENVWEYYFEQDDNKNNVVEYMHHDLSWRNKEFTRDTMYNLITKYVRIKQYIIDEVYQYAVGRYLGVHIRLTDKRVCQSHGEPKSGEPVPLDNYVIHIDKYVEMNPQDAVLVCSDEQAAINSLVKRYGDRISLTNSYRSKDYKSIHHNMQSDKARRGAEALIDCLVLSKSNFLFKGVSNLALCALFFNKDLQHFNLNDYYHGDKRESFVEQSLVYA